MTPQFLLAGAIALIAAAIHGGLGEAVVVRPLFAGEVPSTRFGGPGATRTMIRVTWHVATLTFAVFGTALSTCGFLGPGDSCRGIGVVAASSFTGFVFLSIVVALSNPKALIRHKGPLAFAAVAALSWWGTI